MDLEQSLLSMAAKSSLKFLDIALGNAGGQKLHVRYTGHGNTGHDAMASNSGADSLPAEELSDRRYLIASITKPILAMAAVQLAADGWFALNDPVRDLLPGFNRGPLRQIAVRHLLTHTSGLPDMLPQNKELRIAHASTQDFVNATAEVNPDFAAGTDCSYSSMGFAVLAAIVESMTQTTCPNHLLKKVFQPLEMNSSWLGIPSNSAEDLLPTVLPCDLPVWQHAASDWGWNSRYWRTLGAAWGGMTSTAEDLGRLAMCLLNDGESQFPGLATNNIWNRHVVRSSIANQTQHITGLAEADRIQRGWGFGWRRNWPDHSATFSDFLPADAFGHWGASGTMMWIDPESSRWCVILTTQPYEQSQSVIQRMSNVIATCDDFDRPTT